MNIDKVLLHLTGVSIREAGHYYVTLIEFFTR